MARSNEAVPPAVAKVLAEPALGSSMPPGNPAPGAGTANIAPAFEPATMSRWLWVVYPLALIGLNAVWGGVLSVLLARQVAEFSSARGNDAGALGLVISVGAVTSLVAQPLVGRLSDLTRVRHLGRRNVWILGAALVAGGALIATGFSRNLVLIALAWAVAMIPLSAVQAALTAVLPERVPLRRRGAMSGLVGVAQIVGVVIGTAVGGLVAEPTAGYIAIAALLMGTSVLFALTTRDAAAPPVAPRSDDEGRRARRLPGLRTHSAFWWTFLGRFLIVFGYYLVAGFLLYILRDYIKVGGGSTSEASKALVLVQGISALFLLVFSVGGGLLADRFGRVRIFVVLSSLLFAPAALILILVPTYVGMIVATAILGMAFGSYLAVDQVLITRVLPGDQNTARDLGLMNIANAGPQVRAAA